MTSATAHSNCRERHGHARRSGWSPEFQAWVNMRKRCADLRNPRYGGRGITVCDRWALFENFLADMGPRPDGLTLERGNSDGHYEPSNCRWASPHTQANNTCRNVFLEVAGVTHSIADWARHNNLSRKTITKRLQLGWSPEAAVSTPVKGR